MPSVSPAAACSSSGARPLEFLAAALIVLVAAVVRGVTGFGFALVAALGFSALWPPELATPIVLLLELVVTVTLLRSGILADVDRRDLWLLCAGGAVGAIVGVLVVDLLPERAVKIGLDVAILASALAALLRVRLPGLGTAAATAAVGFVTGGVIAALAVGGPLVVAFLIAAGRAPAAIRATVTVYFGLTDGLGVASRVVLGTIPPEAWLWALGLCPVALLGVFAGVRVFAAADPVLWKRYVALFLMAVALAGVGRAIAAAL